MRSTVIRAWLLATALLVVSASVAVAQEGPYRLKPGARGKKCLECHVTVAETTALPHVHAPVAAGDCADCHNPHSSSHGKLLADEPSRICAGCHDGIVPQDATSVHKAILDGGCVTCHDPHAAENPKLLFAKGNELCATCHDTIAEAASTSRFKHSPAVDSCVTCHNPHASTEAEFLLESAVPELCVGCHDVSASTFVQQHMGYSVGKSDCTSCHNPHGSNEGALLWANVHAPLSNKMCSQCHNEPGSPDALQTKRDRIDLCRGCHSSLVNEAMAQSHVHGPLVAGKACLNCHAPHASPNDALLASDTIHLCGSCHRSTIQRQEASLTKHPPIEAGECASCHLPHSSNAPYLLVADDLTEVCGACHDWKAHSSHPLGPELKDPRNPSLSLDCTSCHRTHGSPFTSFAHRDPKRDLCVECHEELGR